MRWGAPCRYSRVTSHVVNVVVVEYWYPVVVVRGFYTVVVVLSVVSNQTRAVSSPRDSTNRHVVAA